jgi:hypothetical protein
MVYIPVFQNTLVSDRIRKNTVVYEGKRSVYGQPGYALLRIFFCSFSDWDSTNIIKIISGSVIKGQRKLIGSRRFRNIPMGGSIHRNASDPIGSEFKILRPRWRRKKNRKKLNKRRDDNYRHHLYLSRDI